MSSTPPSTSSPSKSPPSSLRRPSGSLFRRHRPISLRLWHWANAGVISGLILTVVLRLTLFRGRTNVKLIQDIGQQNGAPVDPKVARKVANALVDRLWEWHVNLGYVLAALILIRGVIWLRHRNAKVPKSADAKGVLHFKLVRATYTAFYIVTLFMVLSGLSMVYSDSLHLSDSLTDKIHDVHEALRWFFFVFVALHVGGVVWAELGKDKGLVSEMIHGGDSSLTSR